MSYDRVTTPEERQRAWAELHLNNYVNRVGNVIVAADGVLRYARRGTFGDQYIWAKGIDILRAAKRGELKC